MPIVTEAIPETAEPATTTGAGLPDKPLYSLRPSKGWAPVNLREVWAHRELLYFLTWRDVKIRYKQTILGVAWAVLQPLLTMAIFALFFGRLANIQAPFEYPLFAFSGLVLWTFFASAVTASGNSLVGSAHLITKVYFPRVIVPTAAVAAGLVDLLLSTLTLFGMLAYYGYSLAWQMIFLPFFVVLLTVLAVGVGLWMSALNVRYRDVRYALPFLIQIWMFASPIIYSSTIVPEKWRWVMALNPVTGITEGFRSVLVGQPLDWFALVIAVAVTLLFLTYAAFDFRRMERSFADII